jgi:hypothetical protein
MTDTFDLTNPDKPKIVKDPDATLDYPFNWAAWLDDIADTIASVAIIVQAGITLNLTSPHTNGYTIAGKTVIVWLSGGTAGTTYRVTCRITTVGGRTDDRSIYVKVKDR